MVLIPGSGKTPGEGNGNPLQYCYLENSVGYNPRGHRVSEPLSLLTLFTVLLKSLYYMDPYIYGHLEMTT